MTYKEAIEMLDYITYCNDYKHCREAIAIEMAKAVLEKQMPIKPREVGWRVSKDSDPVYEYYCPKCSEKVYKPNPKRYNSGDKYCCKCGQALNWEE